MKLCFLYKIQIFLQRKMPEKIGHPCMQAFEIRWEGIKNRLVARKSELNSFADHLATQAPIAEKFRLNDIVNKIEKLRSYLFFLTSIVDANERKRLCGMEVFLDVLDNICTEHVGQIKKDLDKFLKDRSSKNRSAIDKSIPDFYSKLENFPFIEIVGDEIKSVSEIFTSGISTSSPQATEFLTVYEYLDVGEELKEDEVTKRLIRQVKDLHNSGNFRNRYISMYSAIIGPSFMGKTQTAFTLACTDVNVIYVNFLPTLKQGYKASQDIYMVFEGIAKLFKSAMQHDEFSLKLKNLDRSAENILHSLLSFRTLGLIYLLLRTRKIRQGQCTKKHPFSIKDWFVEIVKIESAIIPTMTVQRFYELTQGNRNRSMSKLKFV